MIILVSILALQLFATSALAAPSKRIKSSLPSVDQSVDSLKFESGLSIVDAENRNVQVIAHNAKPLTKEENIFQQIVSYKEKTDAYAMQPGWTLVKYDQYDILPTTGPKPLPTKHQRETWSHFDETKQVFEEVEYVIAPELGRVLLGYFAGDLRGTGALPGYAWSGLTGPNPNPGWGVYVSRTGTAYSTAGGTLTFLGVYQNYVSSRLTIRSSGWSCS